MVGGPALRNIHIAASLACLLAEPAAAALTYQHKPGITPDQYAADNRSCAGLSDVPRTPAPYVGMPYNSNLSTAQAGVASGIAGLLVGITQSGIRRQMVEVNYRKCMSIKGYTRRILPPAEALALRKLDDSDKASRMAARAGEPVTADPIDKD